MHRDGSQRHPDHAPGFGEKHQPPGRPQQIRLPGGQKGEQTPDKECCGAAFQGEGPGRDHHDHVRKAQKTGQV